MSPIIMSPLTPRGHQHTVSSASANGTAEVTTIQPVSLRQSRGARLSFLGGRKKEHQPAPSAHVNGGRQHSIDEVGEEAVDHTNLEPRRTSFFHSHSFDNSQPKTGYNVSVKASNDTHVSNTPVTRSNTDATDWITDSGGGSRGSYETRMLSGTPVDSIDKERQSTGGAGTPKLGGVKKRLSLLQWWECLGLVSLWEA